LNRESLKGEFVTILIVVLEQIFLLIITHYTGKKNNKNQEKRILVKAIKLSKSFDVNNGSGNSLKNNFNNPATS